MVCMEFQYTNKTNQMFENIKKNITEFPDTSDIYFDMRAQEIAKRIAKEYYDFVMREFERCGYTLEELTIGRHKLEKSISGSLGVREIHRYFVDDKCVLEILIKDNIVSKYFEKGDL